MGLRRAFLKGASERLVALEGLRGIAAIVVVLFHAVFLYWSYAIVGDTGTGVQNIRFEDNFFANPMAVVFSGTFAVSIFFVLSGFVLTVGFFSTGREAIIKKLAAKRYLRLMLPALASVMLAWLLMALGLSFNHEVQQITQSTWLANQWNHIPDFFAALRQGVWEIFVGGPVNYNGVLWTMTIEFLGSFMVFLVALLFGRHRRRGWVYLLLVILTFNTWYLGFVLGMILADLYSQGKFPFKGVKPSLAAFLLIIGLFFGGYPFVAPPEWSLYHTLVLGGFTDMQNIAFYTTIGAVCVIVASLTLPWLERFLSHRHISGLGKYTFALYLTHKLVLFTVTVGLFLWLSSFCSFNVAAIISIVVSLPVMVGVTYAFERFVDKPSIRVSGVFAEWLLGDGQMSTKVTNKKS